MSLPDGSTLRRPVQINRPEDVVTLIDRGYCDSVVTEIRATLDGRERKRRQEVLASVREVYGEAAVTALVQATAHGGLDV